MAHLEHRLGDVDLVLVQMPRQPSKSRSTWKPVTRSPLARTRLHGGVEAFGVPTTSRADSMICEKPAPPDRGELGGQRAGERDRVHAEIGDVGTAASAGRAGGQRRHRAPARTSTPPR
jgi:hypothetical protein